MIYLLVILFIMFIRFVETPDQDLYLSKYHLRCEQSKIMFFHGTGTLFPESLGYLSYIMDNHELEDIFFVGASGGALCACVAAMNMSAENVLLKVIEANNKFPPWRVRKGNEIFEEIYDAILPKETKDIKNLGVLTTCVYPFDSVGSYVFKYFPSRERLTQCLIASKHIPFLMSKQLGHDIDSHLFIDGVFSSLFDKFKNTFRIKVQHETCTTTIRDCCYGVKTSRLMQLYIDGYDRAYLDRKKIQQFLTQREWSEEEN